MKFKMVVYSVFIKIFEDKSLIVLKYSRAIVTLNVSTEVLKI